MSFLDFTPTRRRLDVSGLFDPVIDMLTERARRKAAVEDRERQIAAGQARQAEQLRFQREQEDRLVRRDEMRDERSRARQASIDDRERRRADLDERRLAGKMTLENQRTRQEREKQIRGAAAAGDFATAEGLGDFSEVDPTTGEVRNEKLFERLTRAPQTVDRTVPEGFEGPAPSDEDADMADAIRTDMAAAEDKRNPRLRIGNVETTQSDLRYAQGRQNAADLDQQKAILEARLRSTTDPVLSVQIERQLGRLEQLRSAVETGAVGLPKAFESIEKAGIRDDAEAFRAREGALGRESAERRAQMQANRPARPNPMAEERFRFSEQKEKSANLRRDVKTMLERHNLKPIQDASIQLPNIVKMLDSGNGRTQQQALITLMRIVQKDSRFSDLDFKVSSAAGVDWLSQVGNWASKGFEGQLGDEVVRTARESAAMLGGFIKDQIDIINSDAESFLSNPDSYDSREAEQLLRRELPGFGARLDAKRGKNANPPISPPAPVPRQGGDRIEVRPGRLPGAAEAASMGLDDPNDGSPLPEDPEADEAEDAMPSREEILRELKRRGRR